uniref:AT-hook motif nuclear-localized protein n=2 Tax=Oryza brachyantha TaxID=4533 RepID=J3MQQ9_ORYBR
MRGRPLGSGNKQQQPPQQKKKAAAQGSSVIGLKPNVITVQVGEDVVSRVMSFSRNGWAVCVLSANGTISNVTLRQADSSVATVNYEGHFEILSLSGSYVLSESDDLSSRTGGLSVSLAGPDGRVLGGGVAGPLNAAAPVQVVIGSFPADGKKGPKGPKQAVPGGAPFPGMSTPTSRGTPSGSSGGPGSPQNQSASGSFNTSSQQALADFPWRSASAFS